MATDISSLKGSSTTCDIRIRRLSTELTKYDDDLPQLFDKFDAPDEPFVREAFAGMRDALLAADATVPAGADDGCCVSLETIDDVVREMAALEPNDTAGRVAALSSLVMGRTVQVRDHGVIGIKRIGMTRETNVWAIPRVKPLI